MKTIYKKLLILMLFLPLGAFAQSVLDGVVTDSKTKQTLPGVNVVVQGSSTGTSTDLDGKFRLTNLKKGDKIDFSFIGFQTQTIVYNSQKNLTIVLEEETNLLQEVVVQIGYGTVKKKDATGSVTTVTTKDFNKGANVTAENLLNGRVAGLTINTSGAPGSGSQIRIRGGASLNASNDPLIVLDGLPIDNSTTVGGTSILSSLNPNTIESITVLKDASATAIYGTRASNGVIIIVTKKGGNTLEAEYNFQYGSSKVANQISVYNADEFRALIAANYPSQVANLGNANTDWQDAIYRRADLVDQSLSLRGKLFKTIPTRLTLGKTYQEGLRLTNQFDRNNVSLSMNPSFLDNHLKIRLNANYSNELNRFAEGVEGTALRFDPTQPVYDPNSVFGGYFEYSTTGNPYITVPLSPSNPVALLEQANDNGRLNRYFGNIEVDYKLHFFPDVRAVVNLGMDKNDGRRTYSRDYSSRNSYNASGNIVRSYNLSTEDKRNKLLDAYLVYKKDTSSISFEATGGYSYQKFERSVFNSGNPFSIIPGIPDTKTYGDRVLVSYFGRANIGIKDKYLLTLTYRRDGSSNFSENNRFANFPAAAFAWKIKDESFLKESKLFSDLKLRLGYGVTGQQDLGDDNTFLYLAPYSVGTGFSQYIFGTTPTPIANPTFRNEDIKWEQTATANIGLDFGFVNNRITGSVDLFYKKSTDLLSFAAISDGSNFSNAGLQNIGDLSTKGVEVTLNADVVKGKDFNLNVNFNASTFERRLDRLALGADILTGGIGGGTGGNIQIHREGYTPNSFYVFKQLYDASGIPIQGAFADLNGDNVINDQDRYIKYNADPDVTFGFASTMNYKNLDLSFNLRASVGNHNYNNVNSVNAYSSLLLTNGLPANIPTAYADTNFTTAGSLGTQSDIYIENASFLRMDNVTLGYSFPNWLNNKASLRLSAGIQNVFVLTEYSGLDPEITNNGIDNFIYPRPRTILIGANLKF